MLHVPTNKLVATILETWHTDSNNLLATLLARLGKAADAGLAKLVTAGVGSVDEHHSRCTTSIGYRSSDRINALLHNATVAGKVTRVPSVSRTLQLSGKE